MKILLLLGILLIQSCAQMEYHMFLNEERARMLNKCQKEGKEKKECEIEVSENIENFRKAIEK